MAEAQSETWTIGRLLTWTTNYLREHGSEFPRLDAEVLLAHTLGCERILLYTRFGEEASNEIREIYRDLVRRRSAGAPVAYLVGHKEFFSLDFEVGPAVLIPRPDSEFVVLEFLRVAKTQSRIVAIDVGTGSGNLAIAATKNHSEVRFFATDASAPALEVARRNANRHKVLDRIEFLEGNFFDPLPPDLRVECILSNPPYIPTCEIPKLPVGVRDYEPHQALDGGQSGLEVVAEIITQASRHLRRHGQLIVEIGAPQESAVRKLVDECGEYDLQPTIYDYAKYPRVLSARLR